MCRLTCYCVRHISLDNKHARPVKARHSFLSRWRAGTELCAGKQAETGRAVRQEELDGEREPSKVLTQVSDVRHGAVSSPQV